ncbi:MAG: OmpA family protein [Deltaproteobacteria bacterium]|uniref:OmpA family protein n=1 Tax=Candidatus Desulfacyla euxinica TaxID=2841693 RepID=A0A8J6MXM1_9DELT|nr:OmpA family protein [Candidatus Desulfacyla euxinica]
MLRIIILTAGVIFLCWNVSPAGEYNFETTSEGIIQKLTGPEKEMKTRGIGTGKWENAFEPDKVPVNRAIRVMRKDKGQEVWETVVAPEKRSGRFINLKIEFDVDSYAIRPDSFSLLTELAKALNDPRLKEKAVFLNGHTDSDGAEDYNLRLSMNRALAVKHYLIVSRSVDPNRLIVYGYGENMPLKTNTSSANKQLNRRVEIVASDR